jgi:hypothetical protein
MLITEQNGSVYLLYSSAQEVVGDFEVSMILEYKFFVYYKGA